MKKISIFMILALLAMPSMALAAPGIPNQFWGTVTYNGQPAADGLTVTAKIDGVEVASGATSNSMYSVIVTDPDNALDSDDIIHLFVSGIDTGKSGAFCNGCITELDLSVTYTSPPPDNGGGSSSTGGGGGFVPPPENITDDDEPVDEPEDEGCVEAWVCSSWSNCVDSIQTRECFDKNDCGTEVNMPFESQPCSLKEEQIKKESQQSGLFGMFPTGFASLAMLSNPVNMAVIGILLAAILIGFYLRNKQPSEKITGKK